MTGIGSSFTLLDDVHGRESEAAGRKRTVRSRVKIARDVHSSPYSDRSPV
jgi:hypothetical protein